MYKLLICIVMGVFTVSLFGCKDKNSSSEDSPKVQTIQTDAPKGMIFIPAGEFIMGTKKAKKEKRTKRSALARKPLFIDEYPQRNVFVDAFFIDKYEVTNDEYKKLIKSTSLKPMPEDWKNGMFPEGKGNHPVVYVNWYDAMFYARWIGKRLPTEVEWEKAARGIDDRLWTWGNEYDPEKGNFGLNKIKDTTPIGTFLDDKSPFGLFDVTGNVKEWTSDWYKAYPGNDFTFDDFGEKYRVIRGSSHIKYGHYYDKSYAMVTHRFSLDPRYAMGDVGMRLALTPES